MSLPDNGKFLTHTGLSRLITLIKTDLAAKANTASLSQVAFSGKYTDMTISPLKYYTFTFNTTAGHEWEILDGSNLPTWAQLVADRTNKSKIVLLGTYGDTILHMETKGDNNDVFIFSGTYKSLLQSSLGKLLEITVKIPNQGTAYSSVDTYEVTQDKVSAWSQVVSDAKYPTEKLVKDTIDANAQTASTAISNESTARANADSALSARVSRLEGTFQYFLLRIGVDTYVDPNTLQPGARTYVSNDFYNDNIGDINIKAWLKYNYNIETISDLDMVSVYIWDTTLGTDDEWSYWRNVNNPDISLYPSLQQTGMYMNSGAATLSDFTNTVHGAIVGYESDGYVVSAGNGKGNVYGWNTLIGRVDTLEQRQSHDSSNDPPLMDGVASAGTSNDHSRGDHVHPSDSSKENVANKVSSWNATPNDTRYPTEKLVYDTINNKVPIVVHLQPNMTADKTFAEIYDAVSTREIVLCYQDTHYQVFSHSSTAIIFATSFVANGTIQTVFISVSNSNTWGIDNQVYSIITSLDSVDNTKIATSLAVKNYIDDTYGAHLLWTGSETAKDVKARNSSGNWNIENLDMTPYKYVICYVRACSGSNADQEGSSFAIRIDLSSDLVTPRCGYYVGGALSFYANDNGAKYGVVLTIDNTKTKVCFNYCDANTTGTTALGRDGTLVRIEGFKA